MSFDLYFCRQNGPAPAIPELREYFSSRGFAISDVAEGEVEFEYHNEATGVHCLFSYSPSVGDELEGCGSSGLTFNMNFNRPSFFAYECMPLVEAFCKHFNLVVQDPQDETAEQQQADATRLISSWRKQNTWAVGAMKKMAQDHDFDIHYLPETSATAWWQYAKVRESLEAEISEDIFVPAPFILINPANKIITVLLWPQGISQFFPRSDYVYLERDKKSFFRTKQEKGLVSYDSVITKIGHLLDDYEFGGLQLKYLRPERTPEALPLIQSFNLEPLDLSQCGQVAPSRFHDVSDND